MGYFHGQLGREREDRALIWEGVYVCVVSVLTLDRAVLVLYQYYPK